MRVLILSCNTGEGHNSCGKALLEAIRSHGNVCEMEDAFRFFSPAVSRLISTTFVGIYRHLPGLFRFGYQFSEEHPKVFRQRSAAYRLITAGTEPLYAFLRDGAYDTVLCTHVFTALMMTELLRRHPLVLRTYFVATDYTCSPSCAESRLDFYCIPDESLRAEFVSCGIPSEKLIPTGIPIRREFFLPTDRAAARQRLKLSQDCRHLLIMCGSMGCGPIRTLVSLLARQLPPDCCVSVICGTNDALRRTLMQDHAGNTRIRIYGFVRDVNTLMDSADLYLTKPGGISTTEATCKRLPMVFVNAVAGCESHNMNYFIHRGAAVTAGTPEALAAESLRLLADPAALERMVQAFPDLAEHSPSERICQLLSQSAPVRLSAVQIPAGGSAAPPPGTGG